MPSDSPSGERVSRRRLLAGVGTILGSGLAGCSGRLPGTEPERLGTETTVEEDRDPRVLWRYPPREGDAKGIGYAAVEIDRVVQRDSHSATIHLTFNSTVGGLASAEPYEGYQPDWFRFQLWPPASYERRLGYTMRIEPPGQWDGFSTAYDIRADVRRTTIELRDVDTQGTIMVPAVFDPGTDELPDRLHCSFTVQASRSGFLGETVRVSDQDSITLPEQQLE